MAAITLANVATRYFTNQSFAWTEEMSVALMVIVTLLGASAATVERTHVRIELVADAGAPWRRYVLALIAALATFAVFGGMTVLGAQMAWDDFRFEVTSPGIGVPQWWYTVWLPVLSAVITVRALQVLVATWRRRG
jgi:TRAP-type C4-dicarboxylate transport system permease small subunit